MSNKYEKNVDEGCHIPETYNRLGMLYKKQNRVDDEIHIYEIASNVIGNKNQRYDKRYYDGLINKLKNK